MKKTIYFLFCFCTAIAAAAQNVSTFHSDITKKVDDAMVFDYQGNLYGSHYMGTNVYKITPAGTSSVFATGFNTPNGLAFNSQNELYVCDMQGGKIFKLSYSGAFLDTIIVPNPSGIIKSLNSDTMIFTQYQSNKVNKLAPDGTIVPMLTGSPLNGPVGLAYDANGTMYIANFNNRQIYSYNASGLNYLATVPGPPSGWLGFITYAKGFLWGTGYNDHKIYKIFPNYLDSVIAVAGTNPGNTNGGLNVAQFNAPNGIIPSMGGDSLYISDYNTGRIRIISDVQTIGIESFKSATVVITVFPSPANDFIQVDFKEPIDSLEIFNMKGEKVLEGKESKINIQTLASGQYLIRVYSKNVHGKARFIKS